MGVGYKLKKLLKQKGMTVAALSRESKIPQQTLYSIINRDSSISFENAILIASILDIDYLELVDIENHTSSFHLKRERDRDDIKRYGHIAEYTYEQSVNYMLDNYVEHTSWHLNTLIEEHQYKIEYNNGSFYLSKQGKRFSIKRDDVIFAYKKIGEYAKNLFDSITDNEFLEEKQPTEE